MNGVISGVQAGAARLRAGDRRIERHCVAIAREFAGGPIDTLINSGFGYSGRFDEVD